MTESIQTSRQPRVTDTELPTTALLSQSDRTWQTEVALDTTDVPYETDPADPWDFDVLVIETPDKRMFKHVVRGRTQDTSVLFRMRGDPYWGINHWYDGPLPVRKLKQWAALKQLEWVDGCISLAPHQATKYRKRTHNPTRNVPLSRDVDEWPDTIHTDERLKIVSLTNCMYPQKIKPLIKYADTVNSILEEEGGYWIIGGKGRYADRLQDAVEPLLHVSFPGYLDARDELEAANVMLHLSYFDSFAGAILEGLASQLPVITTSHPAFEMLPTDKIDGSSNQLKTLLKRYTDPQTRQRKGDRNERIVENHYNHNAVGQRWQEVLAWATTL